jgi:hypothetical protein
MNDLIRKLSFEVRQAGYNLVKLDQEDTHLVVPVFKTRETDEDLMRRIGTTMKEMGAVPYDDIRNVGATLLEVACKYQDSVMYFQVFKTDGAKKGEDADLNGWIVLLLFWIVHGFVVAPGWWKLACIFILPAWYFSIESVWNLLMTVIS